MNRQVELATRIAQMLAEDLSKDSVTSSVVDAILKLATLLALEQFAVRHLSLREKKAELVESKKFKDYDQIVREDILFEKELFESKLVEACQLVQLDLDVFNMSRQRDESTLTYKNNLEDYLHSMRDSVNSECPTQITPEQASEFLTLLLKSLPKVEYLRPTDAYISPTDLRVKACCDLAAFKTKIILADFYRCRSALMHDSNIYALVLKWQDAIECDKRDEDDEH